MNKKIFVIEDDPDINRLLCRILQQGGYQVLPAFSGTEAKLVLELEKPDLILLDLMLPGMTGEELISFIRKEKNIQAPILILSAKHALENKIETLTLGADDYLTKPFEELISFIRKEKNIQAPILILSAKHALENKIETLTLGADDYLTKPFEPEEVLVRVMALLRIQAPILILSAKHALENKIETLTLGADDYLTKPFEPEEVLVRVMALLRRAQTTQQPERKDSGRIEGMRTAEESKTELRYKNLMLCPDSRTVFVRETEISLTPHEYDILLFLMRQPEKVFSRETLYEKVWQNGYYGEDNTVNVHVSNIRKKIAAQDADNEYIRTVWGIGFKLA